MTDSSTHEIREALERNLQEQAELQRALEQSLLAERDDLVDEIRDLILSRGQDIAEIAGLLPGGRKRRAKGRATSGGSTRYANPDNPEQSYSRGPLPGWFKEGMGALGLDPSSKDDRETYKRDHLKLLDA